MRTHLYTIARGAAVILLVLFATPARAQSANSEPASPPQQRRSSLRLLLGAQAGLLSADMISTAHALQLGGGAREGNPILRPFSRRPIGLAAVSGAMDVLQTYTIVKLNRRHPKIARVWAVALVGMEGYAVTNNIRVARRLRGASGGIR